MIGATEARTMTMVAAAVASVAAIVVAGAASAQVSRTPPPKPAGDFRPGSPIAQPIPYSHKTHVALGLKCTECHAIAAPGDFAGFPSEKKCMACHVAIKKDSPHIAKLAAAAKEGVPVSWRRVYRLKEFVYFSHEVHVRQGKVECAKCHGEVRAREVLFQEKPADMYSCMGCHAQMKAPNTCDTCHDTH